MTEKSSGSRFRTVTRATNSRACPRISSALGACLPPPSTTPAPGNWSDWKHGKHQAVFESSGGNIVKAVHKGCADRKKYYTKP
ncbi:hypothetical protein ACIBKX_11925 [Streptomyces sp. NPDC050658]|uniref:hypothetical protein n=1 Tax=unclassified Streptomyces TaxID=2593676 RepID=UPI0034424D83